MRAFYAVDACCENTLEKQTIRPVPRWLSGSMRGYGDNVILTTGCNRSTTGPVALERPEDCRIQSNACIDWRT